MLLRDSPCLIIIKRQNNFTSYGFEILKVGTVSTLQIIVGVNIANDLSPPSTIAAVTWLLSPTRRSHVVQYDTLSVTIVAVFSAVDGPVVPPMDGVSNLAVRT